MNDLANQKVLVTGAGGFIGSHLVEALVTRCARVTALLHYDSRPHWSNLEFFSSQLIDSIEVISGDVTDPHFVHRTIGKVDTVFHLAALIAIPYSYVAPSAFFTTNVLGTLNVLEACRDAGVNRAVFTSTSECYGTARTVPIQESHPLQAQSPYSASKIGADKAVESFFCAFGVPVVTIRPFNTYGPRQSARAIVPTIISQTLSDSPNIQLGSLSPVRDMTYVSDTVAGFISAATADGIEGEVINLGVGEGYTIGDLVERIFCLTGIRKEIVCQSQRIRPEKSEVMQLISDNTRAKNRMGWKPEVTLDEGLRKTIDFVRNNPDFYKTGRYVL